MRGDLLQLNAANLILRDAKLAVEKAREDAFESLDYLKRAIVPFVVFEDHVFGTVWHQVIARAETFERFFLLPLVCKRMHKLCKTEVALPRAIVMRGLGCDCLFQAFVRAMHCVILRAPKGWLKKIRVTEGWDPTNSRPRCLPNQRTNGSRSCIHCKSSIELVEHTDTGWKTMLRLGRVREHLDANNRPALEIVELPGRTGHTNGLQMFFEHQFNLTDGKLILTHDQ